ncbi:MAG: M48 family metallopeptidase [Proteobacteria bacterium]|nr:M48 family metallopeptidase [Pseudomonadota bacterium]
MSENTARRKFLGEYADGQSTANTGQSLLEHDGDELIIRSLETNEERQRWQFQEVEIEVGPGISVLRHKVLTGQQFICHDPEMPHIFKKQNPALTHGFHLKQTHLAIGLVIVFFGLVALIWLSANTAAQFVALRVPAQWEQSLSSKLNEYVTKSSCESVEANRVVGKILARLVGQRQLQFDVKIKISNSPDVNAFALPGGVILLNRGFLQQVNSPEEVAAVLAHEIQHVEQRHVMSTVIRASFIAMVWSVIFGDMSSFIMVDPGLIHSLATTSFSRQQEASADLGGLKMLDEAGISRQGFKDFFLKISKSIEGKGSDWATLINSHPSSSTRMKMIGSEPFRESRPKIAEEGEFAALKNPCNLKI